jgi:hypothetical protein
MIISKRLTPWAVSTQDQYQGVQQQKMTVGDNILISSPYLTQEHHLDLSSVPPTSQKLALALRSFTPTTNEYTVKPYSESFNWQEIINQLPADFEGTLTPSTDMT